MWLEIGPGLPWKDSDVRLRDGVSRSFIDMLAGWDVPLQQRLIDVASDLGSFEHSFPTAPNQQNTQLRDPRGVLAAMYNGTLLPEIVLVIRDAGLAGVDTEGAEAIAMNLKVGSSDYSTLDGLKNLLIKFGQDPAVKSQGFR